jgi:hypothetical protein
MKNLLRVVGKFLWRHLFRVGMILLILVQIPNIATESSKLWMRQHWCLSVAVWVVVVAIIVEDFMRNKKRN